MLLTLYFCRHATCGTKTSIRAKSVAGPIQRQLAVYTRVVLGEAGSLSGVPEFLLQDESEMTPNGCLETHHLRGSVCGIMDESALLALENRLSCLEASSGNLACSWRMSEDIEALSRRLDALERFCRPERSGEDGLQAQIYSVMKDALCDGGSMEQTRDCSGLRAKAAVDQLWETHTSEMKTLKQQMADMQGFLQELKEAIAEVPPVISSGHKQLEDQVAHACALVREEACALCAQLRTEMLDRVAVLETSQVGMESPSFLEVFPASPQAPQRHPTESTEATLKVRPAPWCSAATCSLQESTEELRKCLKDLNDVSPRAACPVVQSRSLCS
eukprot:s250_g30.t1